MKTIEDYALKLGKFWINFHSLELLLRLRLTRASGELEAAFDFAEGDEVPLSHLTNFDTFSVLAEKYNAAVPVAERKEFAGIIELRDALAHGRSVTKTEIPMTVTKFSRPSKGAKTVCVTFSRVLSGEYLDRHIRAMHNMIRDIAARIPNATRGA